MVFVGFGVSSQSSYGDRCVRSTCNFFASWLLCLDFRFSDVEFSYELVHQDLCM